MSADWTPTTEHVREQYTREEPPRINTVGGRRAEFDRWLAAHDAELREQIASAIEADLVRLEDGSLNAFGMGQEHAARIARGSTPTTSEAPVMGGGVSDLTDEQLAEKVRVAMEERLSWASLHWPRIPTDALTILAAVAVETLLAAVRRQRNTQEHTA